jgi:hypothetical protein
VMHEPARSFDIIQSAIHVALYFGSIGHPGSPTSTNWANAGNMLFGGYYSDVSAAARQWWNRTNATLGRCRIDNNGFADESLRRFPIIFGFIA